MLQPHRIASGNIIGQNIGDRRGERPRPHRIEGQAAVLAKGTKHFTAPKAGKLRLKVGRKGRAAIQRALRKPGRQTMKILYLVGFTERGSKNPTVFAARQIKLRE